MTITIKFDETARQIFNEFYEEIRTMKFSLLGLTYCVRKYDALFLRLCIVHHMMRHVPALVGMPVGKGVSAVPLVIDEQTALAVRQVVMEFCLPHAKKIYGYFGEHTGRPEAEKIAEWILRTKRTQFARRDVVRFLTKRQESKFLDAPLEYLEQVGWVQKQETGRYPGKGGRPGEKFLVNPMVLERFVTVSE